MKNYVAIKLNIIAYHYVSRTVMINRTHVYLFINKNLKYATVTIDTISLIIIIKLLIFVNFGAVTMFVIN